MPRHQPTCKRGFSKRPERPLSQRKPRNTRRVLLIDTVKMNRGAPIGHQILDVDTENISSIGLNKRTGKLTVHQNHRPLEACRLARQLGLIRVGKQAENIPSGLANACVMAKWYSRVCVLFETMKLVLRSSSVVFVSWATLARLSGTP